VTATLWERSNDPQLMRAFAAAIHVK